MNKIGIYKITSPSGKVYIGQSWNIDNRVKFYRTYNCKKQEVCRGKLAATGGLKFKYA